MRWLAFAVWLGAVGVAHAGAQVVGLAGDAAFTAAPGAWTRTFVAYADTDKEPLPELAIRITDFQTASGRRAAPRRPIEPTWLGGKDAPHDAASFAIAVELPEPDVYIATLVVSAGGRPLVRQLTIQVGGAAAPAAALPVERIGPHDAEAAGDHALLALGVRNTSAVEHTLEVAPPVVTRKRAGRVLPADAEVRWSLVPGAPAAAASGPPPGSTLRLAGGGAGAVQVEIFDASPGEYAVDVRLGEPGAAPATISGAVFVRRGIAAAIAVIASGVLLASAISRLRDVWLDSQSQRINLGRVVERLQLEPIGDAARDTLRELRQQADDLARAITDRRNCRAEIENLGRRAVVFARAAGPAADLADLGDGRRDELRRKLDEVFRLIALPTGETAAEGKLLELELEAKDAARQELKAALDALDASLADHRIEADAQLTEQLGGIAGRAAHVRALYQRDELDAAERALAAVRDELTRCGRDAIRRATDHAPPWTSAASWGQAMAKVVPLLAAPDTSYDALRAAFVDATAALTMQESRHPDTAALAAAKDMPAKLRLMEGIHAEMIPMPKGLPAVAALFGGAPVLELASPERAAPAAAVARPRPEPFEWRALARRSKRVELLVLGVVMAIAVVAGVKALWIDNATWGSAGDLLAAFLWGSGVQVGAEAFVGLAALRAALGKRL